MVWGEQTLKSMFSAHTVSSLLKPWQGLKLYNNKPYQELAIKNTNREGNQYEKMFLSNKCGLNSLYLNNWTCVLSAIICVQPQKTPRCFHVTSVKISLINWSWRNNFSNTVHLLNTMVLASECQLWCWISSM